jgi:hypothetical protein
MPNELHEVINNIESHWRLRVPAQDLKPKTQRYKHEQAAFFAGAAAALNACRGADVPPRWFIAIVRGDDIAKLEPLK